jgi:hypothetical protein
MSALRANLLGNCFFSPTVEYLLIGSAWSLVATLFLLNPATQFSMDSLVISYAVLAVNCAHFAASTVRLYNKPSFGTDYPVLAYGFPLITLVTLAACVVLPEKFGANLWSLYLSWSPYHYAAQAYGLSVMYSGRSGVRFSQPEQRLLFWICLLPFFVNMAKSGQADINVGLSWIIPWSILGTPAMQGAIEFARQALSLLTFAAPLAWYFWHSRQKGRALPLMPMFIMATNGVWWVALDYMQAFVLATVAHGLQYLAIMLIFHVREKVREPGNTRPAWLHAVQFYGICLVLGYGLFFCWPFAFQFLGAGLAQANLMVIATINIHHFIVDRYIWRLRGSPNARTMADAPAGGGAQAA